MTNNLSAAAIGITLSEKSIVICIQCSYSFRIQNEDKSQQPMSLDLGSFKTLLKTFHLVWSLNYVHIIHGSTGGDSV